MIKMEEPESLTINSHNDTIASQEIQDLQKEVINLNVEDDLDRDSHEMESIDDLKASILNHD